jgi:hypothetical protein
MTDAEYADIVRTHGRRVANRVVLSATPMNARQLSDFYDCYGPESPEELQESAEQGRKVGIRIGAPIGLPPHERCITGLIDTFDPCGWHVHYAHPVLAAWREPENSEPKTAAQEQATPEVIATKVMQSARLICSSLVDLKDRKEEMRTRGNALIAEHTQALSTRFQFDADKLQNMLVVAVEELLFNEGDKS